MIFKMRSAMGGLEKKIVVKIGPATRGKGEGLK